MSQFSDSRHNSGPPQDTNTSNMSIFGPVAGTQQKSHVSVSNLTKNLLSSQNPHDQTQPPPPQHLEGSDPLPRQPPLYSASIGSTNDRFLPGNSVGSSVHAGLVDPPSASTASSFTHPQNHFSTRNSVSLFTPTNGNMSYIPLGHNTPTVVLSSYTSNYSYTPSFHSTLGQQDQTQNQFTGQPGFLSSSYKAAPGAPTTNVSMDSANPNLGVHTALSLYRNSLVDLVPPKSDIPNLLPTGSFGARPFPSIARMPSDRSVHQLRHDSTASMGPNPGSISGPSGNPGGIDKHDNFAHDQQTLAFSQSGTNQGFLPTQPDHYMTYKEYLEILNNRDANASEEAGYEEHLNIVDYPVNELITMLACLLTKIIEANDKLHPNHFDNTIAIRQKLKEDKKLRKLQREQHASEGDDMSTVTSHEDHQESVSSDDEEDELKNRYLANVLAFHGTNVPGISLHAYLTRVLKYCPVTNEVFLSLLVYFDRIAKKANNLRKKKKEGEDDDELEQLFVMDSYNIHRLIILGITVSSKFFSDIFYKNLRYAKVGGLPLEELNYLELQFLLLLDFKLMISVEDLQNYGDLLLKFWKREQLANELVNTAKPSEQQ